MMIYGSNPFLRSEPHNFECFIGEEANADKTMTACSITRPSKGPRSELIKINLGDEGREAQPVF